MTRSSVRSSAILSIGYSAEASALEIEFIGGAVYLYRGVPPKTYLDLVNTDSKNTYFNVAIRPKYPSARA